MAEKLTRRAGGWTQGVGRGGRHGKAAGGGSPWDTSRGRSFTTTQPSRDGAQLPRGLWKRLRAATPGEPRFQPGGRVASPGFSPPTDRSVTRGNVPAWWGSVKLESG